MPLKILFFVFALAAVSGAVSVVLQRQPLYSVLSLVVTLISLAAIYVTLEAQFIAAIQVIVYAGAIMVLFIFVIMLLNVREEMAPDRHMFLKWLALPVGLLLVGEVLFVLRQKFTLPNVEYVQSLPAKVGDTNSIGQGLFGQYLLPFEVTSVLILMALVGAVVLARREEKQN